MQLGNGQACNDPVTARCLRLHIEQASSVTLTEKELKEKAKAMLTLHKRNRDKFRTVLLQCAFSFVRTALSFINLTQESTIGALRKLQSVHDIEGAYSVLSSLFPEEISVVLENEERLLCPLQELANVIYWTRTINWKGALGPSYNSPTGDKHRQGLSIHKNCNFDPKTTPLYVLGVYLLDSSKDNNCKCDEAYIDGLYAACFSSSHRINIAYMNKVYRTSKNEEIILDKDIVMMGECLAHMEKIFNASVLVSGDTRNQCSDRDLLFTTNGLEPSTCKPFASVLSLVTVGASTSFLQQLYELLTGFFRENNDVKELNDDMLRHMHGRLKCIFENHIKSHSELNFFKKYVRKDEKNINNDGFCGYAAIAAICLRYLRIQKIIQNKGKLTNEDYKKVKHKDSHDKLCDDMRGLYERFLQGIKKVERLIINERKNPNTITVDLETILSSMKIARDYIYLFVSNPTMNHEYFYHQKGWCMNVTLPLMSFCLFEEHVPLMLFCKADDIPSHMQLFGSTLPMQKGIPRYETPESGFPMKYETLYEMLHDLHSNAVGFDGINHFFVATNVDSPSKETE